MEIFTIGFTKTTAEHFFGRLRAAGVTGVVDVRLRNTSQLAAFAKYPDLPWFLDRLCGMGYRHDLELAPTATMLSDYRKGDSDWAAYEAKFRALMQVRGLSGCYRPEDFARVALLCSEAGPEQCHRRIVAELLAEQWRWEVIHL